MIVTVEAKGPFGVLAAEDKKWKSISNKALRDSLSVGKAYEVVMDKVKCKDGKTRTQVVKASEIGKEPADALPAKEAPVKDVAPAAKAVSPKADIAIKQGLGVAEKDSRILVQGLTQALLQSSEMALRGEDEPFEVFVEERVMQLVEIVKKLSKVS